MALSSEQRRQYRSIAHNLKPLVTVSEEGPTEGMVAELERALNDHELIKVKLASTDREARQAAISDLCQQTGAELVQSIGRVAVLLRRAKEPNPKLSNLRRTS
ncbi:MAG: ribosome assembly RNA-binding protein YhbY [Oleiphilaceae bacterium]|nr:ribosome assembly RNA-binding protein YhbY [Oleiphilaceae bacterium]